MRVANQVGLWGFMLEVGVESVVDVDVVFPGRFVDGEQAQRFTCVNEGLGASVVGEHQVCGFPSQVLTVASSAHGAVVVDGSVCRAYRGVVSDARELYEDVKSRDGHGLCQFQSPGMAEAPL